MIFNLMKPVPVPVGVGDYSGTTDGLIGYAWCTGKAVPVYNAPDTTGKVPNAQYARFYLSELPEINPTDYPGARLNFGDLYDLTDEEYMEIMVKNPFETVGDFPFLSLLRLTDLDNYAPFGVNGLSCLDDYRGAAVPSPIKNYEFFDIYISGGSSYGVANVALQPLIRYNGEGNWYQYTGSAIRCAQRGGGTTLTPTNVSEYLVLTETPTR